MMVQKLLQGWSLRVGEAEETLPVQVPGSVYADLLRNGRMEDPFWRDNEMEALKLMENDFEYICSFTPKKRA